MIDNASDPTQSPTPQPISSPMRVLIVDDFPQVRADLRLLLELVEGIELVGEAGDGCQALAQARAWRPDVVLMDLEMPEMDGFEATRQIVSDHLAGRVILMSIHNGPEIRQQALAYGAADFYRKGEPVEQLIQALLRP